MDYWKKMSPKVYWKVPFGIGVQLAIPPLMQVPGQPYHPNLPPASPRPAHPRLAAMASGKWVWYGVQKGGVPHATRYRHV